MKRILVLALLASVVLAGAVLAGPMHRRVMVHPGDGPGMMMFFHGGDHLAEKLGLDEEQKAAVKQIHEEGWAKTEPLREQHHQQMREIHELLDSGNANATDLGERMIAAHATRQQLHEAHKECMAKVEELLTEEQRARLKELQDSHHRKHPSV